MYVYIYIYTYILGEDVLCGRGFSIRGGDQCLSRPEFGKPVGRGVV